ncbi:MULTISPECIES: hypothetical protein [Anaerococcus]|jgi:hypothetical protein|uniref:Uncharacterized protein n=1 Tax=Anaerococcus nagyae TaxID=1755241 RepID=A0A3E2THJ8_9FIRM|nr:MULTISPECIES: hypothetical protein [Anaerococcus]MBP2069945.1 asparagine N-glycosylation enzyme membrane subunit Stt3 [Anaerococcus nagyae]MDU1827988.1 hypothetical protein [Anaerococcus sp.]MDU1863846.1 hypothetical protein [Anaerococcus sp.]MDU2353874.1 hypothetical protein [Anaerococcus sp.]MDU3211507.1 hypothetical protein [Anaerococcus sp.]
MEILLIKNMIWPALMTVAIISFLDYILDRKKMKRYIAIAFTMIGIIAMVYFMVNNSEYKFLQIFLFMFLLSISLVILALKKRIDAFTMIGIILMLVMLILLLRTNLI